jgi:hypothetical protein
VLIFVLKDGKIEIINLCVVKNFHSLFFNGVSQQQQQEKIIIKDLGIFLCETKRKKNYTECRNK